MTLVAAYVDHETRRVHMMADTYSFQGTTAYPNSIKIDRRTLHTPNGSRCGDVLFGHAGEHSVGFVARNMTMPTTTKGAKPQLVIDSIARKLQEFAAEVPGRALTFDNGCEQEWLVAWNGHLWCFVHYDIIEYLDFGATGAGEDVAIGAIEALRARGETNPQVLLQTAGEITAAHNNSVRPPFVFETLEPVQ